MAAARAPGPAIAESSLTTSVRVAGRLLLLALPLLGACASLQPTQEPTPEQLRLERLESRVDELESRLGTSEQLEVVSRLQALEERQRELRGQVETATTQGQGEDRVRQVYLDLDRRLRALEAGAPVPNAAADSAPDGTAGPAPDGDQAASYEAAFDELKAGNYEAAAQGFGDFLQRYPQGELAPNAWYWRGESRLALQDHDAALASFQQVVERFPDSGKAPDALLKSGFVQIEQGRQAEARQALQAVSTRYPGTPAARLASERLAGLAP